MAMLTKEQKEEKSTFPSPTILFLGGVFLLFPLAHLSVFGLPLYLGELPLILAIFIFLKERSIIGFFRDFRELARENRWFFLSAGLFLFSIVLSALLNPHETSTFGRLKGFYVVPLLLALFVFMSVRTESGWRWIMQNWLWGVMAAALAALIAGLEGFFLYDGRLAGLYQSANYLALLVAPGVLLSVFFIATARRERERAIGLLGLLLSLGALILTRSYAAWLAVSLVVLISGVLIFAKKRNFRSFSPIFLLPVVVFSLFFSFEQGSEKWQQLVSLHERSSFASRIMIWRTGVDIAREHLFFGIGTARFQAVYLEYQERYTPYLEWAVPTPHNLPLHFLLEGGILALVGWIGVLVTVLFSFLGWWRKSKQDNSAVSEPLLGISLILFYLIYGLVDTPYMKNDLVLAVWGSIVLLLAILRIRG